VTEKEIENQILGYLVNRGIFCWKNDTVGVFDRNIGEYRKQSAYHRKGIPDILSCLPGGRMLAIEVKTPTGRVSKEQEFIISRINELGGIAFVARNIEDVEKNLLQYLKG